MRTPPAVKFALLWLSCVGLLLPEAALAANIEPSGSGQPQAALRIGDVVLGPQRTLRGQVVDPQGMPVSRARVVLFRQTGAVVKLAADTEGRFAVSNLPQGTYLVVGGEGAAACRVWAARTAPPSANSEVLVVSDGTLVRGQNGLYTWISEHFLLTSAAVAAAITVPVVLANDDDDRPASP